MTEKTEKNVERLYGLKTAIWLYWKLWEKNSKLVAEHAVTAIQNENDTHLVDAILGGLVRLSFSLKSKLTPEIIEFGPPRICLKRYQDGEVRATWLGDKSDSTLNVIQVREVLAGHLVKFGNLEEPIANLATETFLEEVFESEINNVTIPGFRRISAKEKSTIVVLELIHKTMPFCGE